MNLAVIIETREEEKVSNALRFAQAALDAGHETRLFLMGEAVEIVTPSHETYDLPGQLDAFSEAGGVVLACGTCLRTRHMRGSIQCPAAVMTDCVKMVEWADKVVTF